MVTKKDIPPHILSEIKNALESIRYGSIEIFVQNKIITQITVRNIHKTSVEIDSQNNVRSSVKSERHI